MLCCGGVLWSHGLTSLGPANLISQLLSQLVIFPAYERWSGETRDMAHCEVVKGEDKDLHLGI